MNKKIITSKEKLFLLSSTDNPPIKYINYFMLFLVTVSINLLFAVFPFSKELYFLSFMSTILILILNGVSSLTILFLHDEETEINVNIIDFIYIFLHYIVPGKEEREIEFVAFCQANQIRPEKKIPLFIEQTLFQFNKQDLPTWVKENLGKEISLYNTILPRCSDNSGFRKELIYWSQLFPRKKLSIDNIRLLLLTNKIVSHNELTSLPQISIDQIESLFIQYEEKDIVKLFTSAYELRTYLNILTLANKHGIVLPVRKTIQDLSFIVKEAVAKIEGNLFYFNRDQEWITKVETSCELGQIVMIDNFDMLDDWAQTMRNCIRSKNKGITEGKVYLFGILQNDCPYIVFELNKKGKLVEAKKQANRELSNAEIKTLKGLLEQISHQ